MILTPLHDQEGKEQHPESCLAVFGSVSVDGQCQEREGDGKVSCQTSHHGHHTAAVSKMEMAQPDR